MNVVPVVRVGSFVSMLAKVLFLIFAGAFGLVHALEGSINLEHRGDYVVGYQYRSGVGERMPPGWTGGFDAKSGVSYRPMGVYKGKNATLLHCPWRGGTGVAFQEFRIQLPKQPFIWLRGATAMSNGSVGKSDGVVFRLFVNGKLVLERLQVSEDWEEIKVDLSAQAGQQVLLRFETDPGPKNNANFDFSLWGDRRIEFSSQLARADLKQFQTRERFALPELKYNQLSSQTDFDVLPWVVRKATGRFMKDVGNGSFYYRDSGSLFSLSIENSTELDRPFPAIKVLQSGTTNALVIPQPIVLRWSRPVVAQTSSLEIDRNSLVASRKFVDERGAICIVRTKLQVINQSVVLEVTSSMPWLNEIATSGWLSEAERILVPTPYYSGQIALLPRLGWFANYFFDWKKSAASSLAGGMANYVRLTNGDRNLAHERIVYSFSNHLEEVFPHVPNPSSPYRSTVAGRVFLDAWGGNFADVQSRLTRLSTWGLDNCVLIVHDWQRSGYDNALPAHLPASATKGGEEAFRELVAAGKQAGCLVAAHQNYADIYPNFEGFRRDDVALGSDGRPQKAWLNTGTGIQSYAMRPNAMLAYAKTQAPEITRRYGTNAGFLDVHSSMPPWFHVDMRASETGAGRFSQVSDQNAKLWQQLRTWHQGPVFGEGAEHWYWSGLLDGVEAQPGAGWELGEGDSAPLAVGFSLLNLHPLQVDHGMGYYHRWSSKVRGAERPSSALLDRYRMQEVAFAHAAYLGAATWSSGWDLWLEQNLVPPVVKRAALAVVSSIRYWVDGQWVSMSAAAWAENWSVVRVVYSNGLEVIANSSLLPLTVDGQIIPSSGWIARGAGLLAWSTNQGNVRSDYSADEDNIFANVIQDSQSNKNGSGASGFKRLLTSFPYLDTDGSVKISHTGMTWMLRSVPNGEPISIRLHAVLFGHPNGLQCDHEPITKPNGTEDSSDAWQITLVGGTICTWGNPTEIRGG